MTPLELPHAHGGPPLRARLKSQAEDFQVEELGSVEPSGEGEHAWLLIRKRGENTEWVARELARYAGSKPMDVSYAGLKDREAVTTQAFTVHLPGRASPDWSAFPHASVEVLEATRHHRKLKRGALRGNRFRIVLREIEGDREAADACLQNIRVLGVPNYFGEQRFGIGGHNVDAAKAMFAGRRVSRSKRSLLLSAARSHLFNSVLAERVASGTWNQALEGDVFCLAGSRSWFGPESDLDAIRPRVASGDVHPSGPMWGRGDLPTQGPARALEQGLIDTFGDIATGLEKAGLEQDRRPLRLMPSDLQWSWDASDALIVEFDLPPGCYATVVMRELAGSAQGSQAAHA